MDRLQIKIFIVVALLSGRITSCVQPKGSKEDLVRFTDSTTNGYGYYRFFEL